MYVVVVFLLIRRYMNLIAVVAFLKPQSQGFSSEFKYVCYSRRENGESDFLCVTVK